VPRNPELGSPDDSELDAHAIVLCASEIGPPAPLASSAEATVVWSGAVEGDGSGPQRSYFVRLYADTTAHCQCPDFYFRATLRRDANYACKHIRRALSAVRRP
jgi:hypothetical protein